MNKRAAQNWLNHGGDLYNRRYANKEKNISPKTVYRLNLKWKFYTGGDVTVTPAVFDNTLYFPSWNGYIYAVKADDGALVWKKHLQTLTGFNNTGFILNVDSTVSRSTPTVAGDLLLVGIYGPAVVIALKRLNGQLVWSTRLDYNGRSFITMSGTYYKGAFYVGTSSLEEGLTVELCCNFRGSLAKLDAKTGKILWQTFMLPDNFGKKGEYAGAAIWGSSPAIDPIRNHVYIATGNLYSAPLRTLDVPPGPSPDADFGEAPLMLTMYLNRIKHDLVVAVQKSGFAWALDRNNGSLVWSMEAGPGGLGGGAMWGAATDEKRIYTNIANSQHKELQSETIQEHHNCRADGWQWMLKTAVSYGPQPTLAMPPPLDRLPWPMELYLVDPHTNKDPSMR
ncbi:hypothetical protein Patl1_22148 [Pistacia atlantica]|uniref:Uncharacterized protein n=1 Tax=Pistacia atlantica TaxID=434234 RepID=A0ACC1BML8_9ROSI|nr:hypothetical protein Patl1_22148 [Pistacia atlantica]